MERFYQQYDRITRYSFFAVFGGIVAVIALGILHLSNIRESELPAFSQAMPVQMEEAPAAPNVITQAITEIIPAKVKAETEKNKQLHLVFDLDQHANAAELMQAQILLRHFGIDSFIISPEGKQNSLKDQALPIAKEKATELIQSDKFQSLFKKAVANIGSKEDRIN